MHERGVINVFIQVELAIFCQKKLKILSLTIFFILFSTLKFSILKFARRLWSLFLIYLFTYSMKNVKISQRCIEE